MIQKTNARHGSTAVAPVAHPPTPIDWGSWSGQKYYSLQVVQNPVRARMCGFGDKDRRPLAPAAVCKMIVRREDHSLVDEDEIDISFLIATVDLWSEDRKQEMNLVLHPSSQDRIINSYVPHPAKRRKGSGVAGPSSSRPQHHSPETSHATMTASSYAMRPPVDSQPNNVASVVPPQNPQYSPQSYPFPLQSTPIQEPMNFPQAPLYGSPQEAPTWSYAPQPSQDNSFDRTGNPGYTPALSSINPAEHNSTPAAGPSESWNTDNNTASAYRAWSGDTAYSDIIDAAPAPHTTTTYNNNAPIDSTLRQTQLTHPSSHSNSWAPNEMPSITDPSSHNKYEQEPFTGTGPPSHYDGSAYASVPSAQHVTPYYPNSSYVQPTTPPSSALPSGPRQTYTRTLVGPLSANACRLNDEHRKPGIFFLFQDLSVRTEGTFRLRLRLMNVGAPPAPDARSLRTHTDVSPVLAQTFTEPFMVYSAKRFPGVPDTTALSISFGSQGQKLPLRNRHGKQSRKRRRSEDFDGSDEEEDGEGS